MLIKIPLYVKQALWGFGILVFTGLAPQISMAQTDECENILPHAENLFFNAAFDEAVEILTNCLPAKTLVDAERTGIYLLLARIYFADQKRAPAAEALDKLFTLNPEFEPPSLLPPPFIEFAKHIREIHSAEEVVDKQLVLLPNIPEEKKTNNRRWLLIGGSGVFAVTAVAIMSGGRSRSPEVFPPAPGPPGQ